MNYINLVIEDDIQHWVIEKILSLYHPDVLIGTPFGKRGNQYIKNNIKGFSNSSEITPCIILTDLDLKKCPSILINEWVNFRLSERCLFRVAVRTVESWLLADRAGFASYIGVSAAKITPQPEMIDDPKTYIGTMVSHSKKRIIKKRLAPSGTAKVGKEYNSCMAEFITTTWNPEEARIYAPSLNKFIIRLSELVKRSI